MIVVLFIFSFVLRLGNPGNPWLLLFLLPAVGVGIALITAWLSGELVERLRIGVLDGTEPDAPSSQTARAGSGGQHSAG